MRRTKLLLAAEDLESSIEATCSQGRGSHRRKKPLLRQLLRFLVVGDEPEDLRDLGKPWNAFRGEAPPRRESFSKATVLLGRYGMSVADVRRAGTLREDELRYLLRLAESVGENLRDLAFELPDAHAQIVALNQDVRVHLDQRALEDLLLATVESYSVPPRGRGRRYTEAFGLCFGTRRDVLQPTWLRPEVPAADLAKRVDVHIGRVVTQLRADASANHVVPNERSTAVHRDLAESLFPHLDLVGDYHTHPYRDLAALEGYRGWGLSDQDRRHIRAWVEDLRERRLNHPGFCLVAAVARRERSRRAVERKSANRVRFDLGGFTVDLAGYRVQLNGDCDDTLELFAPNATEP